MLIVRYAERRVESAAVAEEIAAEVFTVAWQKWDPSDPFDLRWLYRTAANKVMNHWERRKHGHAAEVALKRGAEEPPEPPDMLERLALLDALDRLKPREAEALKLTVWEGLSADEVAWVLDCSVTAVWKLLSRARQGLRRIYRPDDARQQENVRLSEKEVADARGH